mgnify:CR=1 FL=1
MLLKSVIITLREVLEAALLLSILLAVTRSLDLRARWFGASLAAGVAGSILYGSQLGAVSNAFEGMGQELLNATLQVAIYLLLSVIAALLIANRQGTANHVPLLQASMLLAVTLAVVREGAEIIIFLSAFRYQPDLLPGVLAGALLGAGIGFSIGALLYYLLRALPQRYMVSAACVLLILVAGGMSLQATQLLIQADWLPALPTMWDSSALLSEESLVGQLLYALVGYEATPTQLEVVIYFSSVFAMALVLGFSRYVYRNNNSIEHR